MYEVSATATSAVASIAMRLGSVSRSKVGRIGPDRSGLVCGGTTRALAADKTGAEIGWVARAACLSSWHAQSHRMPQARAGRSPCQPRSIAWHGRTSRRSRPSRSLLAAAPIVAVLAFGAGAGRPDGCRRCKRCHFCCCRSRPACSPTACRARRLMVAAEALRAIALASDPGAGRARTPDAAAARSTRIRRSLGTVAYSVAAPALVPSLVPAEALPAPTRASSLRARSHSRADRLWRAC